MSTDPFEGLAAPVERREPRTSFRRDLRRRLVADLGLDSEPPPTVDLPERKRTMNPTTSTRAATTAVATPYLAARDAAGALDWYLRAFSAVEQFRVVGDDGRLGHAEFTIGDARFMLSDEYPDLGVQSPASLGGTATTIHLDLGPDGVSVDDLFAQAVDAGATSLAEPTDQPHGARHGTLVDPYGHRWMLSQQTEDVSLDEYAERSEGSGFRVEQTGTRHRDGEPYIDGIWAAMTYADPAAGIRFVTEVLGFEELVLVVDDGDPSQIIHSEYRWPEGGIVQVHGWVPDNEFVRPPGEGGVYVVTADPYAVWERCRAAGVEVLREPAEPHYDPGGMGFSIRDPEGNIWSFGSYAGGSTG